MPQSIKTADEYDIVEHEETAVSPEILDKIREWLQPTDYLADSGEFRRHLASQAPGTGLWICETDEYRKWHDSPNHGSLWIKGVPGAGKSVMAASIIHHLKTTENCPVLFFFFRNIVAANFSPRALIQDWLAQLLPHSPKLQFALQSRLDTKLEETSDNDLIDIFLNGASHVPKLYCVGDALDEMTTENRPFLDKLNSLATHRPRSLKLLITSRPKQYLQSALRDSSIVHISLQQLLVDADINSYLRHRFDTAVMSEDKLQVKEQLIDMVAKRSEGLFLYAKLTMDQIEAALADDGTGDIDALEQSLPIGLEQTYTSMLAKQRNEKGISTDLQVFVLEAVTHSSRPLRLGELASLVKFVRPDLDAPAGFKNLVATCCGPLIEVLEDETLQVIHHSFTEFLRGDTRTVSKDGASSDFPVIKSLEAHRKMAINCLQYLQSGTLLRPGESAVIQNQDLLSDEFEQHMYQMEVYELFSTQYTRKRKLGEEDSFDYREARLHYPFLGYAVENWAYHASHYDVKDEEFFNTIQDFIKPDSLGFRRWLPIQWGLMPWRKGVAVDIPKALHIAAFAGMSEFVSDLIGQRESVSSLDEQWRIPLHWAATNGHAKVASLLIQHGSDPNAVDRSGLRPIHLAAKKNHSSVVKVLLEAGVDPTTPRLRLDGGYSYSLDHSRVIKGENALLYASEAGHTETIEAMIPFCGKEALEQLLCECCRFSRTDSVLAILDKTDVSVNFLHRGGSPLHYACISANFNCAKALIKRGADLHKLARSKLPEAGLQAYGTDTTTLLTPLNELMRVWNKSNDAACRSILKLLVKAGVDLEQTDSRGSTALFKLVQPFPQMSGGLYVPALEALLEAGANAKATSPHHGGNSPLHTVVAANRSLKAVQLLLNHGADPNQRDEIGYTPFHSLIHSLYYYREKGDLEMTKPIIKLFLDNGADPEIRNKNGHTPMSGRPTQYGPETFALLFSKCKSDAVRRECWFELHKEWDNANFTAILKIMLAAGMDIDQRDQTGRTLYLHCLTDPEKRRILREHGATTGLRDNQGNNAIHLLSPPDRQDRAKLECLFAEGLDPLSTNDNGDTLLHHCASDRTRNKEYVRWLLSLGIPVNAVNKQGHTALHVFLKITCQKHGSAADRADFINLIKETMDADYEIRDGDGLTPLHLAATHSGKQVARLMAAGAHLGALTSDFQNVLHLACRARKTDLVAQILGHLGNIDVNQVDKFGRTPLHYACASGEAESVALLLKHGGNVNAVDSKGSTLLHACAESAMEQKIWDLQDLPPSGWLRTPHDPLRPKGSIKYPRQRNWGVGEYTQKRAPAPAVGTILKMLLDAKLDPSVVDREDRTGLDIAILEGCVEFVDFFYRDEELLNATTKRLKEFRRISRETDHVWVAMKAQMAMMRPRSWLETLEQDKSLFEHMMTTPSQFLELVPHDDIVKLINQGFEADPENPLYYNFVEELMKPGHLKLIEKLPHLISHYSTHESLKGLLWKQEEIHEDGSEKLTPLQIACRKSACNMLTVQYLVEKLQVDINIHCAHTEREDRCYGGDGEPASGSTALHILASGDGYWQLEALKYLIDHGADINAVDEKGRPPIHIATSTDEFWRSEVLDFLLEHGADLNIMDQEGQSLLHMAADSEEATRRLLQRGADPTVGRKSPLFATIHEQNIGALNVLLDHGISVDVIDKDYHGRYDNSYTGKLGRKGYAVLIAAITPRLGGYLKQSMTVLRALVERGADLYLPLNEKETIAHYLFEIPSPFETANDLLKEPCVSRIDFNHRDQLGRTVLMAACCWHGQIPGYFEIGRTVPKARGVPLQILDHGADATLVDHNEIVVEFINREEVAPTLWLKDSDGFTPFQYALRSLRPAACNLLLDKGAPASEPDPEGLTPLHHIAAQCLKTDIPNRGRSSPQPVPKDYFDQCLALWRRIIAQGCSINATDKAGNTPLHTYLAVPERTTNPRRDPTICHVAHFDKLFPADSNVDVSVVNDASETALHIIAARKKSSSGRPDHDKLLFEILLARGVDPLREDAKGRSALDVASACGNDEVVGILSRK
ncbi:NACHT domain-containing protein [Fusarium sp. LHS14.1]|nr:NACHT domain-containing protein [Fusarium sp. LHS14.1]